MTEKKYTIKPGGKITIEINDPSEVRSPKSKVQSPKGLIKFRREDEYLPRRRSKQEGIFARIFDMGMTADFEDIAFVHNSPASLVVNPISASYQLATSSDYAAAWNDFILGAGMESWSEAFAPIEDISEYGFSISGTADNAPGERGFPIAESPGLSVAGGNAFRGFDTSDATYYKVTREAEFSASEAAFVLDASIDVFLMPVVMRWLGSADVNIPGQSDAFPKWDYRFGGYNRALPRNTFLYNPFWLAQFGTPMFASSLLPAEQALPVYNSALRAMWKNMFVYDENARVLKINWNGNFSFRNYISHAIDDPENFPTNETPGVYVHPSGMPPAYRPHLYVTDGDVPAGLLVAAIRKGEEWFFVWHRTASNAKAQGGYMIAT